MTKLRKIREEKGLKQKDLAQILGIKTPAICIMERKGIFDIRTANKYAKALNISPFFLLENCMYDPFSI